MNLLFGMLSKSQLVSKVISMTVAGAPIVLSNYIKSLGVTFDETLLQSALRQCVEAATSTFMYSITFGL